jgi:hypothetical protein
MAPTTNSTARKGGKEALMSLSTIPQVAALRSEWVAANSGKPERILSALGHPGYGRAFAGRVLDLMAETGCGTFEAVYGLQP